MALHSRWSSGDLVFYDGTQDIFTIKNKSQGLEIGKDTSGVPLKFYGDAASAFMNWNSTGDRLDFDLADIKMGDTDNVYFGDANDMGVAWDATRFVFTAAVANSDIFFGSTGLPIDIVNYGNITYRDPSTPSASTGTLTLTTASERIQFLDPGSTHSGIYKTVVLPDTTGSAGVEFRFFNVGTGSTAGGLDVQSTGTDTVLLIEEGCGGIAVCDGTTWLGFQGKSS